MNFEKRNRKKEKNECNKFLTKVNGLVRFKLEGRCMKFHLYTLRKEGKVVF